jgi:hypothetical protein
MVRAYVTEMPELEERLARHYPMVSHGCKRPQGPKVVNAFPMNTPARSFPTASAARADTNGIWASARRCTVAGVQNADTKIAVNAP